jgi:uncharacterized membrane protein
MISPPAGPQPTHPPPNSGGEATAAAPSGSRTGRVRSAVNRVVGRLGFAPIDRWILFLTAFVIADIAVLSWFQIEGYLAFYTFAQDFGSFNQSMYTATFTGRLFYYTANIPAGTNGTFFAVHFAPLLYLIIPFYALAPSPITFLVIKQFVLALAAYPLYGLASRRLGSRPTALLLALAYLFTPITLTLSWDSFDMEVFLPFFILTAFYFLERRMYPAFFAAWLLALATIETSATLLAIFAGISMIGFLPEIRKVRLLWKSTHFRVLLAALILCVVWIVVAAEIVASLHPGRGVYVGGYQRHFAILGASSLTNVVPQAAIHPIKAYHALRFQYGLKAQYILLVLACAGFLPIFGEFRYSITVAAWLLLAALSDLPSFYSFGTHYLAYVTPFLFAGAIGGIERIRRWIRRYEAGAPAGTTAPAGGAGRARKARAARFAIVAIVVLSVGIAIAVANPFIDQPVAGFSSAQFGVPATTANTAFLDRVIDLVPNHASVLTTNHIFPQLSNRVNAYVLPDVQFFAGNTTYQFWTNNFLNRSTYVLMDFPLDPVPSQLLWVLGNFTGFGVVAGGYGVLLLERGWSGPPIPGYWVPTTYSQPGSAVARGSASVINSNQTLRFSSAPAKGNQTILSADAINRVTPGVYRATISYRMSARNATPAFEFAIQVNPVLLNVTTPYHGIIGGNYYNFSFQPLMVNGIQNWTNVSATSVTPAAQQIGAFGSGTATLELNVTSDSNNTTMLNLRVAASSLEPARFTLYVSSVSLELIAPPTLPG